MRTYLTINFVLKIAYVNECLCYTMAKKSLLMLLSSVPFPLDMLILVCFVKCFVNFCLHASYQQGATIVWKTVFNFEAAKLAIEYARSQMLHIVYWTSVKFYYLGTIRPVTLFVSFQPLHSKYAYFFLSSSYFLLFLLQLFSRNSFFFRDVRLNFCVKRSSRTIQNNIFVSKQ